MANTKTYRHKIRYFTRESFAIIFWGYILTKLFIYDVDLLVVNRITWLQRIYPYKLFIFIAAFALFWIFSKGKKLALNILYIVGYPLVLLGWRVPKLLLMNWTTVLMFMPAIESVALRFKWRVTIWSFAMLAAIGVFLFIDPIALRLCMSILGFYLLVHYLWRLRSAYRPESIFSRIATIIGKFRTNSIRTFEEKDVAGGNKNQSEPTEFNKTQADNVKTLYLTNLLCAWLSTKIDNVVSSRRSDLYFIVALIYTFLLTVIVFGFEYWALYKIDASNFTYASEPSTWAFFVYSFNVILHTSFATVAASKTSALIIANAELVGTLIIGVFLVFVIFTSHRERYRQDLAKLVIELIRNAEEIETYMRGRLKMTMVEVEVKIIRVDPAFSSTLEVFGRVPPQIDSEDSKEKEETKST